MKKAKYMLLALVAIYAIIVYLYNTNKPCEFDECNNKRLENGEYCLEHTCEWEDCTSQKGVGKAKYCYYHVQQSALQYQKENQIKLSDSQLKDVRDVVDNYCKQLMSNQSNILEINFLSENPETSTLYITYRCNVVREDDDTNLATIYVSINKDGTFKVDSLMYDE